MGRIARRVVIGKLPGIKPSFAGSQEAGLEGAVVLRAGRHHPQGGFCRRALQLTLLGDMTVDLARLSGGAPAVGAGRDLSPEGYALLAARLARETGP